MNEPTNVETLLLNEIGTLFSKLEDLEPGTDEYSKVNSELVKLIDRAESMEKFHIEREEKQIERENCMARFEIEREDSMARFEIEREEKRIQMKEDRMDRFIKYGIAIGTTALEVGVLIWGAKKSWKFEETGTITSSPGRSFMGKIYGIFKRKC